MNDPTRIDIDHDPERKRLRGITIHKHLHFDVPYISHIVDNLWMGGCTTGLILPRFIHHVVSLYPWEQYVIRHEVRTNLQIVMYDSPDQTVTEALEAARWVNSRVEPTLVHCQAGLNRSSLVVALTLRLRGYDADSAIELIRKQRSPVCLCNSVFEKMVREAAL